MLQDAQAQVETLEPQNRALAAKLQAAQLAALAAEQQLAQQAQHAAQQERRLAAALQEAEQQRAAAERASAALREAQAQCSQQGADASDLAMQLHQATTQLSSLEAELSAQRQRNAELAQATDQSEAARQALEGEKHRALSDLGQAWADNAELMSQVAILEAAGAAAQAPLGASSPVVPAPRVPTRAQAKQRAGHGGWRGGTGCSAAAGTAAPDGGPPHAGAARG